ncbi:hypothetical protein V6B11_007875 [Vibrio anguillarum]|uniref:hypothetical protein n=1 Tax=Vibrio anguillarum TaxID=55601 RepID=UPI001AD7FE20|nr:hypothetical protein [Vibrio anguillarum]MBT2911839.1 hypothetical protein [Vibrio anguillarum]MBT2944080.1 hypothetical protein [Vibrio anguillarum]MBT2951565.1 hypothetical protein [Vibrio anguillarum]
MQYVLVCDSEILNNTCPTGFKSVSLQQVTPQYLTLQEFQELAPETILFLCACYVWKKLRS